MTRAPMRFVSVKSADRQGVVLLHRARDRLVRQRTMLICALRSHLAEFGIGPGQGKGNFAKVVACREGEASEALPALAVSALRLLAAQIDETNEKIQAQEKAIVVHHRSVEAGRRLANIPGIGPIIASAIPDHNAGKCHFLPATQGPTIHDSSLLSPP